MKNKFENQLTGLAGEFFIAAELAKRNFQVSLTLGNAKSVDLIAINLNNINEKIYQVEVKTLRKKPSCFTLDSSRIKKNTVYIFAYLNDPVSYPDYFILFGHELLNDLKHFYGSSLGSSRETVNHGPLQKYKNCWNKLN